MGTLFSYSIYSSILLSVLYLAYKWVMSAEKQPRLNRIILWCIYIISLGWLPASYAFDGLWTAPVTETAIDLGTVTMAVTDPAEESATDHAMLLRILLTIYLTGISVVALYTAHTLWQLVSIIRCGHRVETDGCRIMVVSEKSRIAPFSFMRTIVMTDKDYESAGHLIILHEKSHIRLHHYIDLLAAQAVCALQWFNPAAWLMREELKSVHEYQADDAVIRSGADIKDYQMLLIKKAVGARFPSLANSLNHSKLKKRITMMYNQKSSKARRLRAMVLVPSLAAALTVTNLPAVASVLQGASEATLSSSSYKVSENSSPEQSTTPVYSGTLDETVVAAYTDDVTETREPVMNIDYDGNVFEAVDILPEFPGGLEALLRYICDNVRYPEKAMDKCVQGNVIVQFIVGKDGAVRDVCVARPVDPDLDAEAVRVAKSLPKFIPGRQNGKLVNVLYTLPINFKLSTPEPKSDNNKKMSAEEVMPKYPGGENGLIQHLAKNLRYPEKAMKQGVEGKVVVRFTVDTEGNVRDPKVVRSVTPELDAEALRVVGTLDKFVAAKVDGKPVNVFYTLPVSFMLKRNTPRTAK